MFIVADFEFSCGRSDICFVTLIKKFSERCGAFIHYDIWSWAKLHVFFLVCQRIYLRLWLCEMLFVDEFTFGNSCVFFLGEFILDVLSN